MKKAAIDNNGMLYGASGGTGSTNPAKIWKVDTHLPAYNPTGYRIAAADGGSIFEFDLSGRHLKTINALTGQTEVEFGYQGRFLNTVTDIDGNITTLERSTGGNPIAIISPYGQRTDLTVNADGYLTSVRNPAGEIYQMTYTPRGLMTGYRDRKEQLNTYEYNDLGHLITDINAGSGGWNLNRNQLGTGYQTEMTTAEGRALKFTVEPLGSGERRQVNTYANGTVKTRIFNPSGQTIITHPDGTVITSQEGPDPRFGMQASVQESLAVRAPTGGLTSTTTFSRSTTPGAGLSEITTVNGRIFSSDYNAATNTYTFTTPMGRTGTRVTNDEGRPLSMEITGLAPLSSTYDPRGRLETILQNDGLEQRLTQMNYYNSGPQAGFLQSITDAENRSVSFEYDNIGRVTRQTLPDTRVIEYGYDANGNMTSITPPGRPQHVFNYNAFNLEGHYTPPVLPDVTQPATVYDYNLDKELVRITRPDGQEINFNYNTGAQLTSLVIPTRTYNFAYNATSGRVTSISTLDGQLNFTYNGFLLTGQSWTGAVVGSTTRVYDNSFRTTSQSVNNANAITFQYDNDDLLIRAGTLNITRDPQRAGIITGTTQAAVQTAQTYNAFGELSTVDVDANSADIYGVSYIRDKLGRITQKTEVIQGITLVESYGYDVAGRLETINRNGITTTYTYDANGNRLSKSIIPAQAGIQDEAGVYDDQDRLLSYGDCSYQYTANGELTQKICGSETTTFVYDLIGNLNSAVISNGATQTQTVSYIIDGQNRRIGKRVNGVKVQGFL
ncbi:MAG TPA: hypothetical protein VGL10_01240, partial [Gammaproteobacteria bacterium]